MRYCIERNRYTDDFKFLINNGAGEKLRSNIYGTRNRNMELPTMTSRLKENSLRNKTTVNARIQKNRPKAFILTSRPTV